MDQGSSEGDIKGSCRSQPQQSRSKRRRRRHSSSNSEDTDELSLDLGPLVAGDETIDGMSENSRRTSGATVTTGSEDSSGDEDVKRNFSSSARKRNATPSRRSVSRLSSDKPSRSNGRVSKPKATRNNGIAKSNNPSAPPDDFERARVDCSFLENEGIDFDIPSRSPRRRTTGGINFEDQDEADVLNDIINVANIEQKLGIESPLLEATVRGDTRHAVLHVSALDQEVLLSAARVFNPAVGTPYDWNGGVRVCDGLFIGDSPASRDEDFLRTNMISYIINCCPDECKNMFTDVELWQNKAPEYLSLDLPDFLTVPADEAVMRLDTQLELMVEFLDEAVDQGAACFIHSVSGKGRAVFVLAAYIMKRYFWSLQKAMEFLLARRPDMKLNPSLISGLFDYEYSLEQNYGSLSSSWLDISDCFDEILMRNTYLNSFVSSKPPGFTVKLSPRNKDGRKPKNPQGLGLESVIPKVPQPPILGKGISWSEEDQCDEPACAEKQKLDPNCPGCHLLKALRPDLVCEDSEDGPEQISSAETSASVKDLDREPTSNDKKTPLTPAEIRKAKEFVAQSILQVLSGSPLARSAPSPQALSAPSPQARSAPSPQARSAPSPQAGANANKINNWGSAVQAQLRQELEVLTGTGPKAQPKNQNSSKSNNKVEPSNGCSGNPLNHAKADIYAKQTNTAIAHGAGNNKKGSQLVSPLPFANLPVGGRTQYIGTPKVGSAQSSILPSAGTIKIPPKENIQAVNNIASAGGKVASAVSNRIGLQSPAEAQSRDKTASSQNAQQTESSGFRRANIRQPQTFSDSGNNSHRIQTSESAPTPCGSPVIQRSFSPLRSGLPSSVDTGIGSPLPSRITPATNSSLQKSEQALSAAVLPAIGSGEIASVAGRKLDGDSEKSEHKTETRSSPFQAQGSKDLDSRQPGSLSPSTRLPSVPTPQVGEASFRHMHLFQSPTCLSSDRCRPRQPGDLNRDANRLPGNGEKIERHDPIVDILSVTRAGFDLDPQSASKDTLMESLPRHLASCFSSNDNSPHNSRCDFCPPPGGSTTPRLSQLAKLGIGPGSAADYRVDSKRREAEKQRARLNRAEDAMSGGMMSVNMSLGLRDRERVPVDYYDQNQSRQMNDCRPKAPSNFLRASPMEDPVPDMILCSRAAPPGSSPPSRLVKDSVKNFLNGPSSPSSQSISETTNAWNKSAALDSAGRDSANSGWGICQPVSPQASPGIKYAKINASVDDFDPRLSGYLKPAAKVPTTVPDGAHGHRHSKQKKSKPKSVVSPSDKCVDYRSKGLKRNTCSSDDLLITAPFNKCTEVDPARKMRVFGSPERLPIKQLSSSLSSEAEFRSPVLNVDHSVAEHLAGRGNTTHKDKKTKPKRVDSELSDDSQVRHARDFASFPSSARLPEDNWMPGGSQHFIKRSATAGAADNIADWDAFSGLTHYQKSSYIGIGSFESNSFGESQDSLSGCGVAASSSRRPGHDSYLARMSPACRDMLPSEYTLHMGYANSSKEGYLGMDRDLMGQFYDDAALFGSYRSSSKLVAGASPNAGSSSFLESMNPKSLSPMCISRRGPVAKYDAIPTHIEPYSTGKRPGQRHAVTRPSNEAWSRISPFPPEAIRTVGLD